MKRALILAVIALCILAAYSAEPTTDSDGAEPSPLSDALEGGESTSGLPARADCPGVSGSIALDLPAPAEDAELTVFAVPPDGLGPAGLPASTPVADALVSIDPLQEGGPFPVAYRICVPTGPHVLIAALDAQGDHEIFGAGDYTGNIEVTVPADGVTTADIRLDRVLTADQAKKGDKPPQDTRRQRR